MILFLLFDGNHQGGCKNWSKSGFLLQHMNEKWMEYMRRTYASAWLCIVLALALSGCNFTQSAFARMTDTISGAFSAASTTLTYFHTNKLTYVYTTSSFENYASELNGLDQKLPSQTGAPERQKI